MDMKCEGCVKSVRTKVEPLHGTIHIPYTHPAWFHKIWINEKLWEHWNITRDLFAFDPVGLRYGALYVSESTRL